MELTQLQSKHLSDLQNKVQQILNRAEGGHDWWHIQRVYENANNICQTERVDTYVVLVAALLHDIADAKFYNGDESIGPRMAAELMRQVGVDENTTKHVIQIIKNMSFKNSFESLSFESPEMRVVQDADRLDAIGAIGIARAFSYGGHRGRIFYDPDIPPVQHNSKESYKKSTAPTINHFYEKLLLLKGKMNTESAKKIATERHEFLIAYLNQFYKEIGNRPTWEDDFIIV